MLYRQRTRQPVSHFFFFNDTATTEIYTLSLHDALPISIGICALDGVAMRTLRRSSTFSRKSRSEEHTSELQSRLHLVCRLLLEKKKSCICPQFRSLCTYDPYTCVLHPVAST